MAYGLTNEQLAQAGMSVRRSPDGGIDPQEVARVVGEQNEQRRQDELDAFDEQMARADQFDERVKSEMRTRAMNAISEGGKGALGFGVVLEKHADPKKREARKAQRAARKADRLSKRADRIGERAASLAERGKLTEARAARLGARQSRLLERAGMSAYQSPGDLYSSPFSRDAENLEFEQSLARSSGLIGSEKPDAAGFKSQLSAGRSIKDAQGRTVGSSMAQYSETVAGQKEDRKFANQLRRRDPQAYAKLVAQYPYLAGK